MFNEKPATNKAGVTEAINALLDDLSGHPSDSPEYARISQQLSNLYALKEIDHKVDSAKRVSAETLAVVGGNLLGIVMIVGHERAHVLTSKALTLLTKVK